MQKAFPPLGLSRMHSLPLVLASGCFAIRNDRILERDLRVSGLCDNLKISPPPPPSEKNPVLPEQHPISRSARRVIGRPVGMARPDVIFLRYITPSKRRDPNSSTTCSFYYSYPSLLAPLGLGVVCSTTQLYAYGRYLDLYTDPELYWGYSRGYRRYGDHCQPCESLNLKLESGPDCTFDVQLFHLCHSWSTPKKRTHPLSTTRLAHQRSY